MANGNSSHSWSRTSQSSNSYLAGHDQEKCPQRQTLWQALRRNLHCRCLCLTVLICLFISLTFWCQMEKINQMLINLQVIDRKLIAFGEASACDEGIVLLPIICMVTLYVGYLIECYHCTTRLILMYRSSNSNVYSYVEQMRQAQPIIWWKAACYHHVRHTRPIARYRNGGTYTNSQVLQERVTTHVSGSYFSYSACGAKDISKKLVGLELYPTTRIYFSKGFAFANERSAAEFDEQRSTFFRSNERYDHYLEIREGLDLVGVNFQEYMITVGNNQHTPWYSNQIAFWVFSVALLSWPLRILLEYNTAYVNYQVVKLFGVNYGSTNETPCPMSRASTVDTISNCMIAPSYSEAMLAERIYCLRSCSDTFDESAAQPQHKSSSMPLGVNRLSFRVGQVPYLMTASIAEESFDSTNQTITIDNHSQGNNFLSTKSSKIVKSCQQSDPPSYEEVIEDLGQILNETPQQNLKTYWNHLVGLFRPRCDEIGLRRSITDKDFFQKLLTVQFIRKPWTSFGDISNNLITNV